MLKYLISVTENTAVVMILLGFLSAYVSAEAGKYGKILFRIITALGFVGAVIIAVLKNTTKVIDKAGGTGMLNVRIFTISTVLLLLHYIISISPLRHQLKSAGRIITAVIAALLSVTFIVYAFPDVLAYPFNFSLKGESVLSTAFFYRFVGFVFGLILAFLIFLSAKRTAAGLSVRTVLVLMNLILLLNGLQQIVGGLQVLYAKRIVTADIVFDLAVFTSNNSDLFIYGAMLLAFVIPVVLWVKSFIQKEPYENPAQHRKIRAKWRNTRRWATTLSLCFVLVVLCLTLFTEWDNQVVELSPAEECEIRGENLYIPLTQVEDEHLHRFEYETPNGVKVRFIVIKKPNSYSYGVGLDACDICGETGYYERNGQIVCKLCDVVMNVNTIGFKGGCNPIVIDYSVQNGYIVVPASTLVEHEVEFTR